MKQPKRAKGAAKQADPKPTPQSAEPKPGRKAKQAKSQPAADAPADAPAPESDVQSTFVAMNALFSHLNPAAPLFIPGKTFQSLSSAKGYSTPSGGPDVIIEHAGGVRLNAWMYLPVSDSPDSVWDWQECEVEVADAAIKAGEAAANEAILKGEIGYAPKAADKPAAPAAAETGDKPKRGRKAGSGKQSAPEASKSAPDSKAKSAGSFGCNKGGLLRWMGFNGYSIYEAGAVVEKLGITVSSSCIANDVKAGRAAVDGSTPRGPVPKLTNEQVKQLSELRASVPPEAPKPERAKKQSDGTPRAARAPKNTAPKESLDDVLNRVVVSDPPQDTAARA